MIEVHAELTADHQRIVLVAGGPEHEIADAAKHLQTLTPLIEKSKPPGALVMPATWPAVVQLANTFNGTLVPGARLTQWATEELQRRQAAGDGEVVVPIYKLGSPLKPYPWQLAGAHIIATLGSAIITDEPGTGKTITAILGLSNRAARSEVEFAPVVVVCPASVVDHWVESWTTWLPGCRARAWRGSPDYRRELAGTADVYVVSYETARNDAPPTTKKAPRPLLELGARSVVIDECHLIKSPQAERSKAVRRLAQNAQNVIALSGTPITHNPGDLWSTLVAMEPGAWPSRERWVDRYCQKVQGDYKETIIGLDPYREPEFRKTLLGQHRRVAKADVLSQLPPKVYSVRTVELPAAWRKAYDQMEADMLAQLPTAPAEPEWVVTDRGTGEGHMVYPEDEQEISVPSVLAQLTRLSQLASAAADVSVEMRFDEKLGMERPHYHVTLKPPSWKVDALLEVLEERPTEPVVAFAPSRQLMVLAGEAAQKAGRRVGFIVGGQTMQERTTTVETFQAGRLDLVCATTGAGGVGLTLTAARTAVFLQRPWSLVESIQAEDRCHRIGSEVHDSIEVVDIVASNTIDTRVRSVLRDKAGQLADLVQDPRIVAELLGGASVTRLKRKAS